MTFRRPIRNPAARRGPGFAREAPITLPRMGSRSTTALPNTLAAIWSYPVREVWTAAEVTGAGDNQTLAVACAFRTDASPAANGPLPG